jgi:hypothetical protein
VRLEVRALGLGWAWIHEDVARLLARVKQDEQGLQQLRIRVSDVLRAEIDALEIAVAQKDLGVVPVIGRVQQDVLQKFF